MAKIQENANKRPATGSGTHLWLVLWRAYNAMRDYALANIRSQGIGLSDFAVLEVLLHKGPTPVNGIGAKVGLTSGSISVAIDRLENKNLVKRRNDSEDRRARVVHLTTGGRKLIECAFAEHVKALDKVAAALSKQERTRAAALLKKLGKAAARETI